MAMLCGSPSVIFSSSCSSSSSTPKLSFPSLKTVNAAASSSTSSFLGFSVARLNASVKTTLPVSANRPLRVRCQDVSVVPENQRWMFEESEVNGPVIFLSFPKLSSYSFVQLCLFADKYKNN